jgi:release factor glutamine methyltransferase
MHEQSNSSLRWTIKGVLQWTAEYFKQKGIPTGRLDAEILLAHCLGIDRLRLYLNMDRPLSPQERTLFRGLVRRRGGREPVALITGKKEFWSILFRTVPGVLIPRPDTEILVEAVLEEVRGNSSPAILEIGTGSGAVSVAVAKEKPAAKILATDIDPVAASTARLNGKDAMVVKSLEFLAADLFSALREGPHFDVICSNPPYIVSDAIDSLQPEIRKFEPLTALDGGADGLDVIRRLAGEAQRYLKHGGALILEIGDSQADAVSEVLASHGNLRDIHTLRDLSGKIRVVQGRL